MDILDDIGESNYQQKFFLKNYFFKGSMMIMACSLRSRSNTSSFQTMLLMNI